MLNSETQIFIVLFELIIGLVFLLWGRKTLRFFLITIGFLGGFGLSELILNYINYYGGQITAPTIFIISLIIAVIGAFLLGVMYKFSFIIAGIFIGWQVGNYIIGIFNLPQNIFIPLIFAVLGAILILALKNKFLILATAFIGSSMLVDALVSIYNHISIGYSSGSSIFTSNFSIWQNLVFLALVVLLTTLGFSKQKKSL